MSTVDNWHDHNYPNGGEAFDVEALYTASDADYLYLAIVQSMPEAGVDDPYGRDIHYTPGDIALNMDVNTEDGSPTGEYGYEYGISARGGDKGAVYYMPDWDLPQANVGVPEDAPSTIVGGEYIDSGDLVYVDGDDAYGTCLEGWSDTWIVEGAIPWSVFEGVEPGDGMLVHYTLSCGNDTIDMLGERPQPMAQVVPEPASIVFVATIAVFGISSRRKKK